MSTILLADDNPHTQRMGSEILEGEGYVVVTVSDGAAAMRSLENTKPALVLADTHMPGLSGYEISRHIKQTPSLESVKVILLQGPLEPPNPELSAQAAPDGFLKKPLDATCLIQTVASLLGPADEAAAKTAGSRATKTPPAPALGANAFAKAGRPREQGNGSGSGIPVAASNPFAELVERALQADRNEAAQREEVRAAVSEVLESVAPALVDRITEKVLERLRQG